MGDRLGIAGAADFFFHTTKYAFMQCTCTHTAFLHFKMIDELTENSGERPSGSGTAPVNVFPLLRFRGPSSSFGLDLSFLLGNVPMSAGVGERIGGREEEGGGRGGVEDGMGRRTEQATRCM